MGLLNYLGGRGSSGYGEGSSRHVESDVGGVTVGGAALEEEKSWEQPDPSVDNVPFTSFDEARPSDSRRRSRSTTSCTTQSSTRGISATRDGIGLDYGGLTTIYSTPNALRSFSSV